MQYLKVFSLRETYIDESPPCVSELASVKFLEWLIISGNSRAESLEQKNNLNMPKNYFKKSKFKDSLKGLSLTDTSLKNPILDGIGELSSLKFLFVPKKLTLPNNLKTDIQISHRHPFQEDSYLEFLKVNHLI